jgi:hypothetical protein
VKIVSVNLVQSEKPARVEKLPSSDRMLLAYDIRNVKSQGLYSVTDAVMTEGIWSVGTM